MTTPADPAAAAAPAASATPAAAAMSASAPAATPAAAGGEWFSGIQDDNIRTWAAGKGWKDPLAAVESNYNLEKLIGFEKAGRTIVLPKEDATPEERAAFYQKIGAPEKADGYKVPEALAQDPVVAKYRDVAHKAGISQAQFEQNIGFLQAAAAEMQASQTQARAVQGEQDIAALRGEWGMKFDENMELGKRAAAQFIPAKDMAERQAILERLEGAMGTGAMLKLFASIGAGLGEHKAHGSGDPGQMGAMTPAEAQARIVALRNDKAWAADYVKGDAAKRAEMERLHRFAYPE